MLSSKVTFICNLVALLAVLALIGLQMLEVQAYTGSMLGFFQ